MAHSSGSVCLETSRTWLSGHRATGQIVCIKKYFTCFYGFQSTLWTSVCVYGGVTTSLNWQLQTKYTLCQWPESSGEASKNAEEEDKQD